MAATCRYLFTVLLAACSFPALAQLYPFTRYTPKDGLPGSTIRNVFQDNRGRLFIMTNNGLSVYDGARFTNYTRDEGLSYPIINDMLDLGPDSFFIATNTNALNLWDRGRIKQVSTSDSICPVINKLYKSASGIFAAADQGFFQFKDNRFIQIHLRDSNNREVVSSFDDIQELENYFLLKEYDANGKNARLFWCHKLKGYTISIPDVVYSYVQVPRLNALIVLTKRGIFALNLNSAKNGRLEQIPLPPVYENLNNHLPFYKIKLDTRGNFWAVAYDKILKISPENSIVVLNNTSGLDVNNVSDIFVDRENILWILTTGSGLVKLVNNELETLTEIADQAGGWISALTPEKTSNAAYFFNSKDHYLYKWRPSGMVRLMHVRPIICRIQQHRETLYLFDDSTAYKALPSQGIRKNPLQIVFRDTKSNLAFINTVIDEQNFIFIPGLSIVAISPTGNIQKIKMPYFADYVALDSVRQLLWAITRAGDLMCFEINRHRTDTILKFRRNFKNVIPLIHPRSITITRDGKVWVGTADNGVFCFTFKDSVLAATQHFTIKEGITDNFIYYLGHDTKNNIWAGTRGGLDKISIINGQYHIDGIMRRNNVFQGIYTAGIGFNDNIWCLSTSGTALRVNSEKTAPPTYHKPHILISRLVTADSVWEQPSSSLSLSHFRNDITIHVAAPSFIDEKQTRFSYLLEGSSSPRWSTPSGQADFNFINLPPATYTLRVKAFFSTPAYESEELAFTFIIEPPWWQTTWTRLLIAAAVVVLMGLMLRYYYGRKLAKQKIAFEKQQAVEQERTRIAMEMHDDLGTGLTSIRYLAGTLSAEASPNTREKINKIDGSAKELIDAMNDIVWTIQSDNNLIEDVLGYIRKQAADQLETAGISYSFELPEEIPATRLSNDQKRNLVLIAKEAVHNIIKHSGASMVRMSADTQDGNLLLRISDNGKGFNLFHAKRGNGLGNMDKRARQINARLDVLQEKGTTIVVQLDLTHTFG